MSLRLLLNSLLVLIVFLQFITISFCQSPTSSADCTTPTGRKGQCINIKQCPSVNAILAYAPTPLPESLREMVAALGCGFEGRHPKVCCITVNSGSEGSNPAAETTTESQMPPEVAGHPNLELLPTNCGIVYEVRVVGGSKPKIFEFPWMARVAYNSSKRSSFVCGGTILNERYILTAAHCLAEFGRNKSRVNGVRIGQHDVSQKIDCDDENMKACSPAYQDIGIEEAIPHPGYVSFDASDAGNKFKNDIGLIRLASPIDFSHMNVVPVCIPHMKVYREKSFENTELWISGWGKTDETSSTENIVSEKIPYVANEQCAEMYKTRGQKVGFRQMCAGGLNGADACNGDGGGPLQAIEFSDERQRYVQYGIISFGPNKCGEEIPSVYTRVIHYVKWILDTIKP